MRFNRKLSATAQRNAERRRREDEAPRLAEQVPNLVSLSLDVEEQVGGVADVQQRYTRRIVVESAPALFLIPCGDSRCEDGGHDVTHMVMRELRSNASSFEGEDGCSGTTGTSHCRRVLHFQAKAKYR